MGSEQILSPKLLQPRLLYLPPRNDKLGERPYCTNLVSSPGRVQLPETLLHESFPNQKIGTSINLPYFSLCCLLPLVCFTGFFPAR